MRIVLVTQRFWPLVGGMEGLIANLAAELKQRGELVTILTARWEPTWPKEVLHREIRVERLPRPTTRGWDTFRFMRALSRWLRKRRSDFDMVCVSGLGHSAYATIGALTNHGCPVVLRAETPDDCHWHNSRPFGNKLKQRCCRADAIIAPTPELKETLCRHEFPRDRIHLVPPGITVAEKSQPAFRTEIRDSLAQVNYDFTSSNESPVIVYNGRLEASQGLPDLIRAFQKVLHKSPQAKLWLIGEGTARDSLFELILDLELRGKVLLPGGFDDVQEVLQAADLFVLPAHEDGMSLSLLEALAAGVPVVATDIPPNHRLMNHEEHGLLVPPHNVERLATAIEQQLEKKLLAKHYATQARQHVKQKFSLQQMVDRHLDLFRTVIEQKRH
ncbi:MAG: glycosyltransferase family 4 protein [Pirellulaceae bacterium]|nr:glycosyltransferase family 4 protein [Pirellulaceae bacterium]